MRSACLLTLSYLFCVLAPVAAYAFGDGSRASNCLTNEHHGVQVSHDHANAVISHHAAHAPGDRTDAAIDHHTSREHHGKSTSDGQCCGVGCVSALPASALDIGMPGLPRAPAAVSKLDVLVEHDPAQLFRPPPSPLSH